MLKNFLMVGTQRTGSTALVNCLNLHAAVACGGEWAQHIPSLRKLSALEQALQADFSVLIPKHREWIGEQYHSGTQWLGCKILFRSSDKWALHPRLSPALWLDRLEGAIGWLADRREVHVIHVVRNDAIEWLKSKYLADKTGSFAGQAYPKGIKVAIPVRSAQRRLLAKRWVDTRLSTLQQTNPYIRIAYEDFLEDRNSTMRALLRFLGCDTEGYDEAGDTRVAKQSKGHARDYILNYDELLGALRLEAPLSSDEALGRGQ